MQRTNHSTQFENEFDAIIAGLDRLNIKEDWVTGEVQKEEFLDKMWDLIRSPAAAVVDDKGLHLTQIADVLNKVDPE